MASFLKPLPSNFHRTFIPIPITFSSSSVILSYPLYQTTSLRVPFCALTTGSNSQESYGAEFLRNPLAKDIDGISGEEGKIIRSDWEDRILEDTVPLVGFVRMILHSGKYESGDRLSVEHEKSIVERLLPYHPECEKKIGCGIDYITVGYHPEFVESRCLFIVQKDGERVDFSYWKCIKGLIRKKHPLYADSFILRHFRRRSRRRSS